jgi:hypothetical protein
MRAKKFDEGRGALLDYLDCGLISKFLFLFSYALSYQEVILFLRFEICCLLISLCIKKLVIFYRNFLSGIVQTFPIV